MAYTLQQLSDFEDIRTVKHKYFRSCDRCDLDLMRSIITEDIVIDFVGGDYHIKLNGIDDVMMFFKNTFHAGALTMHQGHCPEITLTGEDSAKGTWYLEDTWVELNSAPGVHRHSTGSCYYYDTYRRENGQWKICRSEYERMTEIVRPLADNERIVSQYLANVGIKPEDRKDISYLIHWDAPPLP